MGDIKASHTPPPPYYSPSYTSPYPQTVLYGREETVGGAMPQIASIQPHLQTAAYLNATPYGRLPMNVKCTNCHENVQTKITYKPGGVTWLIFALCFILGFVMLVPWCLCWIPFVVKGTKTAIHSCPKCKYQLAVVPSG